MVTITTLRAFSWKPQPPEEGKRTPPELRAQSFAPHRVESVHPDIARFAVKNGYAKLASGEELPVPEAPKPAAKNKAAEAKAKAEAEAKAKAEAEAKAKAEAEAKAKQGGAGGTGGNPPPEDPPKLKFYVADPKAKSSHVMALIKGQAPVQITEQPLSKGEAEQLVADLEELNPATVEEARTLAQGETPAR